MSEGLDFSLPERDVKAARGPGGRSALLVCILVVVLAQLGVSVVGWRRGESTGRQGRLDADAQKELALKLENGGLHAAAARAWEEYVASADLDDEAAARIWYRMGTVYQEGRLYAEALESYYRSERLAPLGGLSAEIGRRVPECLEAMGRFAALRHELAARVSVEPAADDPVVAEIGAWKITEGELDRLIEADIERQLLQFASQLPDDERARQREALLKQFAAKEPRRRFLEQYVFEELLYREARESKLTETPEVRRLLESMERNLLAQQAMQKALSDGIKITPGDVATWYEANKSAFVVPERARISRILVADEAAAKQVAARLAEGGDFAEIAREVSMDEATRDQGGEVEAWVEKGGPGGAESDALAAAVFATEAGEVAQTFVTTAEGTAIVKVREREPARERPFEEVKTEAYRRLRAGKEREVQERLLSELTQRYDVVIHRAALSGGGAPPREGD